MDRSGMETVSGWWYLLGGAALGLALGLLVAPRALLELRVPQPAEPQPAERR